MKRIFYLLSVFCFFIGCKEKKQQSLKKLVYYPSKIPFNDSTMLVRVNLDDIKFNDQEIKDLVNKIYENDSIPYLEFIYLDTLRKLIPLKNDYGDINERDALEMTDDSIFTMEDNYPIGHLNKILKKHYENKGKLPYYSTNFQNAYIEINLDTTKSGSSLLESLKNIIEAFNEVNSKLEDSLQLNVTFRQQIPPPPPPPPEQTYLTNGN